MKKGIFIGVIILFVFGGGYTYWMFNKPHENIKKQNVSQHFDVDKLISNFSENRADADADLKDKVVSIAGEIKSIKISETQHLVTFDNGGNYLVLAYFDDELSSISHLEKGQKIKLKGKYAGVIINDEDFLIPADIKLVNCYILEEK